MKKLILVLALILSGLFIGNSGKVQLGGSEAKAWHGFLYCYRMHCFYCGKDYSVLCVKAEPTTCQYCGRTAHASYSFGCECEP